MRWGKFNFTLIGIGDVFEQTQALVRKRERGFSAKLRRIANASGFVDQLDADTRRLIESRVRRPRMLGCARRPSPPPATRCTRKPDWHASQSVTRAMSDLAHLSALEQKWRHLEMPDDTKLSQIVKTPGRDITPSPSNNSTSTP